MSKEKKLNVAEALGFTDDLMFQNVMKDPEICRMFLQELEQDYGDDFSKAELENFIKNAQMIR